MSHNVVILGTQWGDEGKGKIVDLLTEQADAVGLLERVLQRPDLGARGGESGLRTSTS